MFISIDNIFNDKTLLYTPHRTFQFNFPLKLIIEFLDKNSNDETNTSEAISFIKKYIFYSERKTCSKFLNHLAEYESYEKSCSVSLKFNHLSFSYKKLNVEFRKLSNEEYHLSLSIGTTTRHFFSNISHFLKIKENIYNKSTVYKISTKEGENDFYYTQIKDNNNDILHQVTNNVSILSSFLKATDNFFKHNYDINTKLIEFSVCGLNAPHILTYLGILVC